MNKRLDLFKKATYAFFIVVAAMQLYVVSTFAQETEPEYNIELPITIPEYPESKPVEFIKVPYRNQAGVEDKAVHESADYVYYNARLAPADHQQLHDKMVEQLTQDGWERCYTTFIDNPPSTQEHATYYYKIIDNQGWSLFVNSANSLLQNATGAGGTAEFPGKYLYRLQKSTQTCDKLKQHTLPISLTSDNRMTPIERPAELLLPEGLKDSSGGLTPNPQKAEITGDDSMYFENATSLITGLYWSEKDQGALLDELTTLYEGAGWKRCRQESDVTRYGKPAELIIFKKKLDDGYQAIQFSTYELPEHEKNGYYNWGPYGLAYHWYDTTGGCSTTSERVTAQRLPSESQLHAGVDAVGETITARAVPIFASISLVLIAIAGFVYFKKK